MADIAAGNVTYAIQDRGWGTFGYKNIVKITFGDGALTLAAAGVPLTKGKLGCPNAIKSFKVIESVATSGYVWAYDHSAGVLLGYYGNYDAADGPLILFTGAAPAAQEIWVEVEGF